MIHIQNLTKQYPLQPSWQRFFRRVYAQPAVDRVSLDIQPGELFGLVGPNGAGKTTLVKMLAGLISPTAGTVLLNGAPVDLGGAAQSQIGLVTSDERSFYWRLTGSQNLAFFAALQGLPARQITGRVAAVLAQVGLEAAADQRFQTYSTGMRQRLSIARALLVRPKVLFLDEPTKGLDPLAVKQLHTLIRDELVGQHQMTVVLTSHQLAEVELLCDRIGIMHRGKLLACGTLPELRAAAATEAISLDEIFFQVVAAEPEAGNLPPNPAVPLDSPAAATHGPTRPGQKSIPQTLQVLGAFFRRDFQIERSYRLAFLLQFFNVFISVLAFYFIAAMFGDAATPYLEPYGGDYFAFVLIGIAFSGYFGVGLNSFASRLREAQTTGTLEAMLNSPVRFSTIIISSVQWDYFMTTLRVFVYILVGGLFLGVRYQIGQFGVALLILLLTVVNFASLGILAASFIMVLKRGNPITWLFGTTSTLLGGVYYPITVLPNWLQILSKLLPVTYALRAMRQTLLPGADMSSVWQDIAVLFGFGVIFIPLSLWAFRFAVRQARIDGSLTHY